MGLFNRQKKKTTDGSTEVKSQFKYDGKKYNVLRGAIVPMPGGGSEQLTAADICANEEAQAYLVANKCGCIEEAD